MFLTSSLDGGFSLDGGMFLTSSLLDGGFSNVLNQFS